MKVPAAIVVLVLALAVAWTATEGRAGHGPLADALGSRCTLGVVGAQATITITGAGAREACEGSLGFDAPFYVEDVEPQGGLVCRVDLDGLVHTVRDVGMNLVGSDVCNDLAAAGE